MCECKLQINGIHYKQLFINAKPKQIIVSDTEICGMW